MEDPRSVLQYLRCETCERSNPAHQCGGCRNIFYCSPKCQKDHYLKHKDDCVSFERENMRIMQERFSFFKPEPNNTRCVNPRCPSGGRMLNPIVLEPCGHGMCAQCLTRFKTSVSSLTSENFHGQCPLGSCQSSLTKSPEELIVSQARKYQGNSHSIVPPDMADSSIRDAIAILKELPELRSQPTIETGWDEYVVFQGYLLLSELYIQLGSLGTALNVLQDLVRFHSSDENTKKLAVDVEVNIGKAFEGQEDWDLALDHYVRARQVLEERSERPISDRWTPVLCGIISCKRRTGDVAGANEAASEIVLKWPRVKGVHLEYSKILEKEDSLEHARTEALKASYLETPWDPYHRRVALERAEFLSNAILDKEERRLFEEHLIEIWGDVLEYANTEEFIQPPKTWSRIQARFDVQGGYDSDEDDDKDNLRSDTAQRLADARAVAMGEGNQDAETQEEDCVEFDDVVVDVNLSPVVDPSAYGSIKLTREVLKWLKETDAKFRCLFIKKLEKLAQGDWGYTTAKLLKGSTTRIYETYLEQKSGQRILWTRPHGTILIWYVAAHKKVSRYMGLIDIAERRSKEQLTLSALELGGFDHVRTELEEIKNKTGDVMLDPKGDIPLKLYDLETDKVHNLNQMEWRPPMHMTPQEKSIVDATGTICVLGRSGTGKTVCISSRIHKDCHLYGHNETFSQLFVARSGRICDYVRESVGRISESKSELIYITYRKLLTRCEGEVFGLTPRYSETTRMDFHKYKTKVHNLDCGLDALVAWTQIRSFIKGSIAAVQQGRHLSRTEYVVGMGKKQCRLSEEQREIAYDQFERYQRYCQENECWDDNDRVGRLLNRMDTILKDIDPDERARVTIHDKLYVDEVQDYTQAEIALFFRICKSGGLFLAGDPAQSVEEGIDFRFEDVRVANYFLYKERAEKPQMLEVNFRSHAGVLKLAVGVLKSLFTTFPFAAKELPEDKGFFKGPRPGVLSDLKPAELKHLVDKLQGVAVLTMDELKVTELQEQLGENTSVLSIRDSKGLEFDVVLIVDFFKTMSQENQRYWKDMLLETPKASEIQSSAPELETQLKQLYTGITRCCKRLLLAETGPSVAFDAFKKWASIRREKSERLIDEMNVSNVEVNVMTSKQWIKNGLKFAVSAEGSTNPEVARRHLIRAIGNFREGNDDESVEKAEAHLESIELREGLASDIEIKDDNVKPYVDTVLRLLKCGLHLEATKLCTAVLDRMSGESVDYTIQELSSRLLKQLPDPDY